MDTATGTVRYKSRSAGTKTPGRIIGPRGKWQFTYRTDQVPLISSRRKLIYEGKFAGAANQEPLAARALVFEMGEMASFGIECGNLSRLGALGVGPKLLAVTQHDFESLGRSRPTIIEEDAGESLASLLVNEVGCGSQLILHPSGTPERKAENQKILYDVYVQLHNAHSADIYHRDLRCENVCIRRFGERPADIRATIIDFDLGSTQEGGRPDARASLYRTLFSTLPSHLAGKSVSLKPNPLELDMGYLAALQYHVERDGLLLNGGEHTIEVLDDFVRYLNEQVGYFGYRSDMPPHARRIDTTVDIRGLAGSLGLVPVGEESFPSPQLLEYARSFHRPYLDGEDMDACMRGPEAKLAAMVDDIVEAKFASYNALRRAQGERVEYEHFDDQPMSLQRSNYAQAEHILTKVRSLGYLLVSEYDPEIYEEVASFTDEQIEALARLEHDRWIDERLSAGWTLGERSHEKLTSPYLIPYDELPERMKEYDRDPARQLISLVKEAGLLVVRPK